MVRRRGVRSSQYSLLDSSQSMRPCLNARNAGTVDLIAIFEVASGFVVLVQAFFQLRLQLIIGLVARFPAFMPLFFKTRQNCQ